jgi:hypothetical protein
MFLAQLSRSEFIYIYIYMCVCVCVWGRGGLRSILCFYNTLYFSYENNSF